MKHLLKWIAVGSLIFGVASAKAEELIVATDTAFVPFEYKDGDKYVGFDIDLWDGIATELGLSYELRPMDFSGIIPALQTGQVDVALAGITIKPERQKVIDFSDGYYDSGFTLMVPTASGIADVEDLQGKILAVKTGTSAADYAKAHFKNTELRLFSPPASSSRKGKKIAAIIRMAAVTASMTICVIALSRGAYSTVPHLRHRALSPTGTGVSRCNTSQTGQAISRPAVPEVSCTSTLVTRIPLLRARRIAPEGRRGSGQIIEPCGIAPCGGGRNWGPQDWRSAFHASNAGRVAGSVCG